MTPPLIEQYRQAVAAHPDTLILMRVGDFYEAYDADACTIADALNLTLTGRTFEGERVSMVGVPFHSVERYLVGLHAEGYRVALMDQEVTPCAD